MYTILNLYSDYKYMTCASCESTHSLYYLFIHSSFDFPVRHYSISCDCFNNFSCEYISFAGQILSGNTFVHEILIWECIFGEYFIIP